MFDFLYHHDHHHNLSLTMIIGTARAVASRFSTSPPFAPSRSLLVSPSSPVVPTRGGVGNFRPLLPVVPSFSPSPTALSGVILGGGVAQAESPRAAPAQPGAGFPLPRPPRR